MKNKKNLINLIIFIILIFFIYYNKNNYIVKINKERVYQDEYKIYLREQKIKFEKLAGCKDIWNADVDGIKAEELAKKNALDSLVFVKIMKQEGKKANIKLSKEDKKEIIKISNKIYEELTEKEKKEIKKKTIKKVAKEGVFQEKVKNYIKEKNENIEIFENIYENLLENLNIKKNHRVWNKIKRM